MPYQLEFYAAVRLHKTTKTEWLDYATIAPRAETAMAHADALSLANRAWARQHPLVRLGRFAITELPFDTDTTQPA